MKNLGRIASIGAICLLICLGFLSYRNQKMLSLFGAATFQETVDSQIATTAVINLASFSGTRATNMLLKIASGHVEGGYVWPQTRQTAIALLAKRRDPHLSAQLSSMLQPYENLATRKAIADSLLEGGCSSPCIASILHYRERIWRGEPDSEERIKPVSTFVTSQRVAINTKLSAILSRERGATLSLLESVYGLGTDDPSPFALALIGELHLKDACPALLRSQTEGQKLLGSGYTEPVEIPPLLKELDCGVVK